MGNNRATLLDIAQQSDPDGTPAMVIEVLTEANPMLQDAPAFPSNNQLSERTTLRSSLPTVQFTQLNKGTPRSKGSTRQQVDTIGFLSALSEVDARMPGLVGDTAVNAYRMNEDKAFMEAMSQEVAQTLILGNELTASQEFTGFYPRLAAAASAISGSQVVSHGALTGNPTSILLVDWGERGAHLIYPRDSSSGSAAGMKVDDLGKIRVTDAAGDAFMALVTEMTWHVGLAVKDPRRIARLADIDIADVIKATTTQDTLWRSLNKLIARMPQRNGHNRVMYASRTVVSSFWSQITDKANIDLSIREYLGEPVVHFQGIPIRPMDQIPESDGGI